MTRLWNDRDIIERHYLAGEKAMFALFAAIIAFTLIGGAPEIMELFAISAVVMLMGRIAYQGSNDPTDYWIPSLLGQVTILAALLIPAMVWLNHPTLQAIAHLFSGR